MRDKLMAMNPKKRVLILFLSFFISAILMFVFQNLWIPFCILMFYFLVLLISTNIEYDKYLRNNFDEQAKDIFLNYNFDYDDFHIGDDKLSAIAISEKDEILAIVHRKSIKDSFIFSPIKFSDIIESSITEDGETIIKVNKGSVIGGAIVGSVIAGVIGATIGGLSADRKSKNKVKKITLMIVVNNLKNPIYEINFMNMINPIDRENSLYKTRYYNVTKWHKMISVILKRNELNRNSI